MITLRTDALPASIGSCLGCRFFTAERWELPTVQRSLFVITLVFAALAAEGCRKKSGITSVRPTKPSGPSNGAEGTACTATLDCAAGLVCNASICEVQQSPGRCATTDDCEQGLVCTNTLCAPPQSITSCNCSVGPNDADGDCEPDNLENPSGDGQYIADRDFTDVTKADTDGDGVLDGCEDLNRNGAVDRFPPEMDPRNRDSDADGLPDGIEDINKNGLFDPIADETDATNPDSDADGFTDGQEDRNADGLWNCSKSDGLGGFTVVEGLPCELNPRTLDTDDDGIPDSTELNSTTDPRFYVALGSPDANCDGDSSNIATDPRDLNSYNHDISRFRGADGVFGTLVLGEKPDDQTCPWKADSDDDGILDGVEDRSIDGFVSINETDPRLRDSDGDGLTDGAEDTNQDGLYDPVTETSPTRVDTDNDGLNDGNEDSGGCFTDFAVVGPARLYACVAAGASASCFVPFNGQLLPVTCATALVPSPADCNCATWHDGQIAANESSPRAPDTDGDGLRDAIEDQNGDGVWQRAIEHTPPRPGDETSAYKALSDEDELPDGEEDRNGNGKIDLGETDPRRADADNDCMVDGYELLVGTNPFNADSDGDGLLDGTESTSEAGLRFRYVVTVPGGAGTCVPITCPGAEAYQTDACPNPLQKDSNGDGYADGFELLAGSQIGSDVDGDGCLPLKVSGKRLNGSGVLEIDPCAGFTRPDGTVNPREGMSAPQPGSSVCSLGEGNCLGSIPPGCPNAADPACDIGVCRYTGSSCRCGGSVCGDGDDACTCNPASEGGSCPADAPCTRARVQSEALACSDGNIRPVIVLRSDVNDYQLALPAERRTDGALTSYYLFQDINYGTSPIGHVFYTDDPLTTTLPQPLRSVFGGIVRLGTVQIGTGGECDQVVDSPPILDLVLPPQAATGLCAPGQNFVVPNSAPTPADIAERSANRLLVELSKAGYTFDRTAGGNFNAHDDQSGSGLPTAIIVQGATDQYNLRKTAGGSVDVSQVKRIVASTLIGGNPIDNDQTTPTTFTQRPTAQMKIQFYRRQVKSRQFNPDGSSFLIDVAQYGAVFAVAPLEQDCGQTSGSARLRCKLNNEAATLPLADLTNGSALARFTATTGTGCEPFDPEKSKSDFLLVIDDSGSMQEYILAIQRATRDVSGRLAANSGNLDWRIGMTTSNFGRDDDAGFLSALDDPYVFDEANYPDANANNTPEESDLFAYQHTAYVDGVPQRCTFGPFDAANPNQSPYCCNTPAGSNDDDYVRNCCMYTGSIPGRYSGQLTAATGNNRIKSAGGQFNQDNTLRCYDFPRVGLGSETWPFTPPYSSDAAEQQRHYLDFLCGDRDNFVYRPIFGARGHLWPPGFVGVNSNERLDGANLLIRNADMLVTQMNRPCYYNRYTPRGYSGSQSEQPLQAVKRTIERSVARAIAVGQTGGRDTRATPDRYALRANAPLFSLIISDEEDFTTKFKNAADIQQPDRDLNQLPAARCLNNGDSGCAVNYCESCFQNVGSGGLNFVETTPGTPSYYTLRIPAARRYDVATGTQSVTGERAYCVAARDTISTTNLHAGARFNGLFEAQAGENENLETGANRYAEPNAVARDVLNLNNGAPVECNAACGTDCQPCMRYLREKQYIDFLGGSCSLPPQTAPSANDPRRYPKPYISLPGAGVLELPQGLTYAITRRAGFQGGTPGSCGSNFRGGDGTAYRDIALATGGRVADICLANTNAGFTDFLDEIVVEAQGVGSPYRLRGNPISSTIQVGVLGLDGSFRSLKRSSVSGFDYSPAARSISFFTTGDVSIEGDANNAVNKNKDAKVYVSYRVWERQCQEECAANDVCAVCACTSATPECCTPTPTFECRTPTPCPNGCGACETCDLVSNTCRAVDPCGVDCGASNQQCDRSTGQCTACAPGATPIEVPCAGESCPLNPQVVCVSQGGVPNTGGATCRIISNDLNPNEGEDCCGADKTCADPGTVCVLKPCSGESCLAEATCERNGVPSATDCSPACATGQVCVDHDSNNATQGQCQSSACPNGCPAGTACAPKPCQTSTGEGGGISCPPVFQCVSDSAASQCEQPPECGCPGGFCSDCPPCSICNAGRCESVCAQGESLSQCSSYTTCCPPGQQFDPASQQCVTGFTQCSPACPEDQFCDPFSGRCLDRGG